MAEMVSITKEEYEALRAAAELVRHPEAIARTILAMKDRHSVSLEEAFPLESINDFEITRAEEEQVAENRSAVAIDNS